MKAILLTGIIVISALAVGFVAMNVFATNALAANGLGNTFNKLIDKADEAVHQNTPGGLGGAQDQAFHSGLCRAGISTSVFKCP